MIYEPAVAAAHKMGEILTLGLISYHIQIHPVQLNRC